ncbi:hypothetical protein K469DRAFT_683242 [Zopfia rhizophila CBS 207.26]|uniref:Uncharacterized protein n=1 Tax=Zopfia rhizophila CBS 207.26 TaxID=1314779 RepID=A0A6A6EIC7_9PEZI|nr:hypothetical protein K469DRAFT_683242 [Zopfia rhizophila CBS 207.26]
MNSAQILYISRSPSAMKPHHLTIPNFSDADIWGASMGTTDLNDYPWKMDAEIASGGNQEVLLPIDAESEDSREALYLLVENALHSISGFTASEVDAFQYFDEEHVVEQQVPNLVTEDIHKAPTETNIRRVNDVETEEPQYIYPEISKLLTKDTDTKDAGLEIDELLVAKACLTE